MLRRLDAGGLGAGSPNRTGDRLITNQVLYLLSYAGMVSF